MVPSPCSATAPFSPTPGATERAPPFAVDGPASGPKCPRVGETDAVIDASDRAREAFERGAWGDVCAQLFAADAEDPLGLEDLERLAVAATWSGGTRTALRSGRERSTSAPGWATRLGPLAARSGCRSAC